MYGDGDLRGWQVQEFGCKSANKKRCSGGALLSRNATLCTCLAIERNSRELIESTYAEPLGRGKLVFRSVDISKEGALAEKYEVSWSSLILVDYDKDGKESSTNLTEFAFGNARTAPNKFKAGLSEQI